MAEGGRRRKGIVTMGSTRLWPLVRAAVVAPLFTAVIAPAWGADSAVKAFLDGIYSHYHGNVDTAAPGIRLDHDTDDRRYFAPDLAAAIVADEHAAAGRDEVPTLDADPFIDAQDWDIAHLRVTIESETATAAHATVRFENFKQPTTIKLDLVATPKGWRIANIRYPGREGSLRSMFHLK